MNVEQLLLAALSIVSGWLTVVVKILWGRSEQCEGDRRKLWQQVEDLKTHNGELRGFLQAVGLCKEPNCQYARPARHTSEKPFKETHIGLSLQKQRAAKEEGAA